MSCESKADKGSLVSIGKSSTEIYTPEADAIRDQITAKLLQKSGGKCQRILLVHPLQLPEAKVDLPIARKRRYYMYPPYALGVLCTNLKKRKYDVDIVDLNHEVFTFLHSDKSSEISNETITATWQVKLKAVIEEFKPDLVGVSCTFTMGHEVLIQTADYVRELAPNMLIFAGGVHVTNAPDMVLKQGKNIDFVSLYESDISFGNIVDYINGRLDATKLSQIGTLIGDEFVALKERTVPMPEDLNIIPDFCSLKLGEYTDLGEIGTFRYWRPKNSKGTAVLSNRGCRAHCSFCSVANFNGKGVRARSIESVLDEIDSLQQTYGINHITWLDDDLFFNESRAVNLFNEMVRRRMNITWDASNGVIASAAVAHPELIHSAAESGCIGMYFGIESGNPKILRSIHKPSGVKHFLKTGKLMKQYPQIFTRGFMIVGFPNETLSQIKDTINLAIEMGIDWYTIQLLTPLPSTEIYNEMVDLKLIEKGSLNTEGTGFTMFSVRESERQRRKEREEQMKAKDFFNLFESSPDLVPSKEQLNEIWLIVDYEVNYGRILNIHSTPELNKLRCFLTDVADRMTNDNPLANLFLGIVEARLGNQREAEARRVISKGFLDSSQYWQKRFDVLGIEKYYDMDFFKSQSLPAVTA